MNANESVSEPVGWPQSLLAAGDMGRRIFEFDWAATAAGPIESWDPTLRAMVAMILGHEFPMYIFWGEENTGIYNDAYAVVAGEKHPGILGMRTQDAWPEVWTDIESMLARVKDGEALTIHDFELTLMRYGFPEQFYHTMCYSPLRAANGAVCGALATFTETTAEVLARRRLETLRRLASRTNAALTEAQCLQALSETLSDDPDVPFALLYLSDGAGSVRLAAIVGDSSRIATVPERLDVTTDGIADSAIPPRLHVAFPDQRRVRAVPIRAPHAAVPIGLLVAGLSTQLPVDDAYRAFIDLLADQFGVSIATARALAAEREGTEERAIARTVERVGSLAQSGRQLFWMAGPDGWIDWYARGWYEYTGQTEEDARGWGWKAAHHPEDLPEVMRRWPECIAKAEPFEMTFRLRGADGRYRWFLTRAVPEFAEGGRVVRWYGTNTDVDEERRAARQLDALARIGERTEDTPNVHAAVGALSEVLVPHFADWTLVNVADAKGHLTLADARHVDETKMRLLQAFVGRSYDLPGGTSASAAVFRDGRSLVYQQAPPNPRARTISEFAEVVEQVGMGSAVVVPIVAGGKVLGTFHGIMGPGGRTYEPRDVLFFEEIGRRIGGLLHTARLFERESRIAESFQNAALPSGMPVIPGMRFSALYRPAARDAKIGGDFHDAFTLLDGRVVVCIGDVAGTGLEAAATMAALRQSIRAAGSINPDPELMLKAADAVFGEAGRAPFATGFVGVIDPVTFSLRYANAGHPRPMLRAPDGSVEELEYVDLLLGEDVSERETGRTVGEAHLRPGSALILYTDGLTEACGNIEAGEQELRAAVGRLDPSAVGDAAPAIHDAVLGPAQVSHDDVAILAIFLDEPLAASAADRVLSWRFESGDGAAAAAARGEMTDALSRAGMGVDDLFAAEMILSELLGNALRYAPGGVEVMLDLTQTAPVLHVLDDGPGFAMNPKLPAEPFSERGRGLFIVTKLARDFTSSTRTLSRGSHVRAVLPGRVSRRLTEIRSEGLAVG